jgi:hypothetical protein
LISLAHARSITTKINNIKRKDQKRERRSLRAMGFSKMLLKFTFQAPKTNNPLNHLTGFETLSMNIKPAPVSQGVQVIVFNGLSPV